MEKIKIEVKTDNRETWQLASDLMSDARTMACHVEAMEERIDELEAENKLLKEKLENEWWVKLKI